MKGLAVAACHWPPQIISLAIKSRRPVPYTPFTWNFMSLPCWILSHYSVILSLVNINCVSFNPTNNCSPVVFVVSNAIIASAAAWNLSIVEGIAGDGVPYPPPVNCVVNWRPPSLCNSDQYLSNCPCGLRIDCHLYCVNFLQFKEELVLTWLWCYSIFLDLWEKDIFISRIWFELSWVTLFFIMELGMFTC